MTREEQIDEILDNFDLADPITARKVLEELYDSAYEEGYDGGAEEGYTDGYSDRRRGL